MTIEVHEVGQCKHKGRRDLKGHKVGHLSILPEFFLMEVFFL